MKHLQNGIFFLEKVAQIKLFFVNLLAKTFLESNPIDYTTISYNIHHISLKH